MTLKSFFFVAFVAGTFSLSPSFASAAEATNAVSNVEADKAWAEVTRSAKPPIPPPQAPTPEEREKYNQSMNEALLKAIQNVKDFRAKYPDQKATEAAELEKNLLGSAYQLGILSPIAPSAPQKSEKEMIAEYSAMQEKIEQRLAEVHSKALQQQAKGIDAVLKEMEDGLRSAAEEFPEDELVKRDAMLVSGTRGLFNRLDSLGKPMNIKFTALDGREVDLSKLKGKVVLIDFWATWCMPCLMEIPHIRDAYTKLHDKGFEVISISLDQDKEQLTKYINDKKIPWLQCFNAEYNFAETYGVGPIPAMWLVDKKGNLRDFGGRFGLEDKVTKLLQE